MSFRSCRIQIFWADVAGRFFLLSSAFFHAFTGTDVAHIVLQMLWRSVTDVAAGEDRFCRRVFPPHIKRQPSLTTLSEKSCHTFTFLTHPCQAAFFFFFFFFSRSSISGRAFLAYLTYPLMSYKLPPPSACCNLLITKSTKALFISLHENNTNGRIFMWLLLKFIKYA